MNFSDSEIVASVLSDIDYCSTKNADEADIVFVNTCSIREHAEQRVRNRLRELKLLKKQKPLLLIGLLGCMAERLKTKLLDEEKCIDIVAGPDAYRNLPDLIRTAIEGKKAINVFLSPEETYADISPLRYENNGISAFISIMRGCENFCSYCVVPYTRGKERSRNAETIINEATELYKNGFREITLLGQNVNSFKCQENGLFFDFPALIEKVALINSSLRIRFATSHPKDMSDELLKVIAKYPNICKSIHLPLQSGSNNILELMNRKYSRDWYMNRIESIRKYIPECAVSTDIISGFCSETEIDHKDTLSLMEWAGFDHAYMFKYSERPDTLASKKYKDDVPEEVKSRRLQEIIDLQHSLSHKSNKKDVGKVFEVLVENESRRSKDFLSGRNSQNKVIIFPRKDFIPGDYVNIKVSRCTSATLFGEIV
ncbi:MAG: tRNA (N6-isopentenyl adenosine(37)-C2)-methylthiotransferase MiaB [Bacteroidetes bacterium]|nr:tRNA (N6-isopentenyl adenosine(37)-C2)-methylthiotransferase MiaB [Bacteroidota bacterium]